MPRYYDYYSDRGVERPSFGKGFNETFMKGLESTMANKEKDRDFELQLRQAGMLPEEEYKQTPYSQMPNIKPYESRVKIRNTTWVKFPTQGELEAKNLETEKVKSEIWRNMNPAINNIVVPGWTDQAGNPITIPNKGTPTPTPLEGLKPIPKVVPGDVALEKEKRKARTTINTMTENNKILKNEINNVSGALARIPTGILGQANLRTLQIKSSLGKATPEDNKVLADYQVVESFLKDQQLAKQTLLKGATSDKDLAIVEKAVAGGFWSVAPQMMPILNKALQKIDAEESAAHKSFFENYGDEPVQAPKPVITQPQQRRKVRVRVKATGQTGTIEEGEFDPNLYDKI